VWEKILVQIDKGLNIRGSDGSVELYKPFCDAQFLLLGEEHVEAKGGMLCEDANSCEGIYQAPPRLEKLSISRVE